MTGWSRRGATRAPTPQRDATCASGETLTAKAPKRAISSSSGRRGPRRSTTATSRPWWPESASLKLLVVSLPHPDARYARACMSQRSECTCEGLSRIFGQIGRAPAALVPGNATEAGRMSRGEVTESRLFSLFRAHYRCASRYRDPYSGNEKGSVENAVGFIRRNLLVPVPSVGALEKLNGMPEAGCALLNAASFCRDGRPVIEALAEDLAAMAALPADPFDAVRWVRARADKRGYVTVDGREYVAGPAWHSRELLNLPRFH